MVKQLLIGLVLISFMGCADDDERINNPNLLNIQFNIELNLTFPEYSQLNFAGNAIYIGGQGIGNDGIIVANTGSGFVAWDASDPNRLPSNCTRLQPSFPTASSSCNPSYTYSLVTGQPLEEDLQYPLLNYRVEEGNNSVFVSN
jgi:hypothetical protein